MFSEYLKVCSEVVEGDWIQGFHDLSHLSSSAPKVANAGNMSNTDVGAAKTHHELDRVPLKTVPAQESLPQVHGAEAQAELIEHSSVAEQEDVPFTDYERAFLIKDPTGSPYVSPTSTRAPLIEGSVATKMYNAQFEGQPNRSRATSRPLICPTDVTSLKGRPTVASSHTEPVGPSAIATQLGINRATATDSPGPPPIPPPCTPDAPNSMETISPVELPSHEAVARRLSQLIKPSGTMAEDSKFAEEVSPVNEQAFFSWLETRNAARSKLRQCQDYGGDATTVPASGPDTLENCDDGKVTPSNPTIGTCDRLMPHENLSSEDVPSDKAAVRTIVPSSLALERASGPLATPPVVITAPVPAKTQVELLAIKVDISPPAPMDYWNPLDEELFGSSPTSEAPMSDTDGFHGVSGR